MSVALPIIYSFRVVFLSSRRETTEFDRRPDTNEVWTIISIENRHSWHCDVLPEVHLPPVAFEVKNKIKVCE
jgi:hypothetical protein